MTIPFLGGLARAAGAAAPYAANALAAKNAAQAQGLQQQRQQQLQLLMLAMQQRRQATQDALSQAQATHYNALTKSILGKRTILRGPGGQLVDATDPNNPVPIGPKPATKPDPVSVHQANRLFDVQHPLPQQPTNVYLPSVNKETGETDYTVVPNRGPVNPVNTGVIKPATGGGAGGQSGIMLQTLARMGMSMNDLERAVKEMDDYENNPANLSKLTPLTQAAGSAAEVTPSVEAHGLAGVANNALGSLASAGAQKFLASSDPAYRQYIFNKQRVATAFTELLPRPNQQLLQIEKGLSGIDVGWSPALIGDVQARRLAGLQTLQRILEASPLGQRAIDAAHGAGGTGGHTSTPSGVQTGNVDLREPNESRTAPSGSKKSNKDYGIFGGPG